MSGRIVPFAVGVTMFAALPFLGGSAPSVQRADVVLAAGAPAQAAVQDAVGVVEAARAGLTDQATSALLGDAVAAGGGNAAFGGPAGLFMFPSISLTPITAQAVAAPVAGPLAAPGFIHPVPGGEVSPFGPRIHPVLHRAMFHTGIDLQASCGTPIRAAADGTVVYARVSNSWGLRTIIQHTSGVKTAYGHQSKFLVKEGDVVKQGQIIGLVGTTGWSTGCHLHFDVIINDRYVDPAPYLGFPASAVDSIPYAVVPHFVIDQSGRTVQTVEDGDVPIPSRDTAGSSSVIDGSITTPTPTSTSSASGTTTTSGSTGTSTTTSSTGTSTGTSTTGTPTTGTTTGSSSTTTTPPPQTSTSTTTSPPATTSTTTSSTTTTTNPPATSGTTTTTTTTTAAPPTSSATTSTSQSTTSAEQTTTSAPAPAATSDTSSSSLAASDTTSSSTTSSTSTTSSSSSTDTTPTDTTSSGSTADATP